MRGVDTTNNRISTEVGDVNLNVFIEELSMERSILHQIKEEEEKEYLSHKSVLMN